MGVDGTTTIHDVRLAFGDPVHQVLGRVVDESAGVKRLGAIDADAKLEMKAVGNHLASSAKHARHTRHAGHQRGPGSHSHRLLLGSLLRSHDLEGWRHINWTCTRSYMQLHGCKPHIMPERTTNCVPHKPREAADLWDRARRRQYVARIWDRLEGVDSV